MLRLLGDGIVRLGVADHYRVRSLRYCVAGFQVAVAVVGTASGLSDHAIVVRIGYRECRFEFRSARLGPILLWTVFGRQRGGAQPIGIQRDELEFSQRHPAKDDKRDLYQRVVLVLIDFAVGRLGAHERSTNDSSVSIGSTIIRADQHPSTPANATPRGASTMVDR